MALEKRRNGEEDVYLEVDVQVGAAKWAGVTEALVGVAV